MIRALIFTLLLAAATTARAQFIYIDVSLKVILHPDDGLWPRAAKDDAATRLSMANINPAVDDANKFLASYGRGYRIRIVEVLEIGGVGEDETEPDTKPGFYAIQQAGCADRNDCDTNPDRIYGYGDDGKALPLIDALDRKARSNATTKAAFKWNENAANVFVPSNWAGGGGIFPDHGNALGFGFFEGWLFLHELGHYYDLYHTFGNDLVADTLTDPSSVTQDAIAQELYGKNYRDLTAAQQTTVNTTYYERARNSIADANGMLPYNQLSASDKAKVDDVFFNLMSYYDPPRRNQFVTRLTEGQLDRLTDTANLRRSETVTGRTIYVRTDGNDFLSGANSISPKRTIHSAASVAAPGGTDIVLAGPGTYNVTTISKPVTIRATRKGPVNFVGP